MNDLEERVQRLEERVAQLEACNKPVVLRHPVKATSAPLKVATTTLTPVEIALKTKPL